MKPSPIVLSFNQGHDHGVMWEESASALPGIKGIYCCALGL